MNVIGAKDRKRTENVSPEFEEEQHSMSFSLKNLFQSDFPTNVALTLFNLSIHYQRLTDRCKVVVKTG